MYRISFACVFAAIAFAQPTAPLAGIEGRTVISGGATLSPGLAIRYRSVLSPGNAELGSFGAGGIGGVPGGQERIARFMEDRTAKTYFGYELGLTPNGSGSYQATIGPLTSSAGATDGFKPVSLPKYPPPLTLRDGDVVALDLMVSANGKQKLTDYIEIVAHEPAAATVSAPPRDFTLDDGPVTYDTFLMTIWADGKKREGMTGFTGKPGSTFWIAFPGDGRYILSLTPYDGLRKAGVVRGNVISFQDGGREYELRFMSPVAGAGKAWNLYVNHDRSYESRANQRGVIVMGTDRLDNLVAAR